MKADPHRTNICSHYTENQHKGAGRIWLKLAADHSSELPHHYPADHLYANRAANRSTIACMMTNSLHKHLALLIDADNAQRHVEHVLKLAEYYGQVDVCRAYGDWEKPQLSGSRKDFDVLKIERVQVNRVGKNATDHRLLMEAGELLALNLFNDPPDVFVIVSGDGGFAAACDLIRERGKQIIGIGDRQKTSASLQSACDSFIYLEDLEDELGKLKTQYPIPPSELRAFYVPLIMAYHRLTKSYDWVLYSELGAKLREVVPDFDSQFGQYKLSEWVRSLDQYFESDGDMVRRIDPAPEQTRLNLLYKAYEQTRGPDGLAHLGQLGNALHALDPDYERHFGGKKLSTWIETYPQIFKLHGHHYVGCA